MHPWHPTVINHTVPAFETSYKTCTKKDLLTHPLADQLKACDSATRILTVLQEQVQEPNEPQRSNTKWLYPIVNVLLAFSETLGEGVGSVLSPAKVIFVGFGVLLSTAKDVRADQDTLFEIFGRIKAFFWRLDIYTKVAPNQGMADTTVEIMAEVLNILAIMTKEIKQNRMKKYLKKMIGNDDLEDAMKRLDRLTQEVARMASAQFLKTTNAIDDDVKGIANDALVIINGVAGVDAQVASLDEDVTGVDNKVKVIDDKLVEIGQESQPTSSLN